MALPQLLALKAEQRLAFQRGPSADEVRGAL